MAALGKAAIASGWRPQGKRRVPYVSVTVFEADAMPGSDPSPDRMGFAAGLIFLAAERALEVDPYGTPQWRYERSKYVYHGVNRICLYHSLEFVASCDDVMEGGPLHRDRVRRCASAMYGVLERAFAEQR